MMTTKKQKDGNQETNAEGRVKKIPKGSEGTLVVFQLSSGARAQAHGFARKPPPYSTLDMDTHTVSITHSSKH